MPGGGRVRTTEGATISPTSRRAPSGRRSSPRPASAARSCCGHTRGALPGRMASRYGGLARLQRRVRAVRERHSSRPRSTKRRRLRRWRRESPARALGRGARQPRVAEPRPRVGLSPRGRSVPAPCVARVIQPGIRTFQRLCSTAAAGTGSTFVLRAWDSAPMPTARGSLLA